MINEATPKSTRERVHRHTRVKTPKPTGMQMVGRVVPKKTGNSDPDRGGKHERRHAEEKHWLSGELQESILFLNKLINNTATKEEFDRFPHKKLLYELVNHLIAVGLGGWKKDKDESGRLRFINESGHVASPNLWKLKGGRLYSGTRAVSWNLDKLFEIRDLYDGEETEERG